MNSTRWRSLTEFIMDLSREGSVKVGRGLALFLVGLETQAFLTRRKTRRKAGSLRTLIELLEQP